MKYNDEIWGGSIILIKFNDKISAISAAQNLEFMHKGSNLTKVRGPSRTYRRFFRVDDDFLSFGYRGSRKIKWARSLCGNTEDMSKSESYLILFLECKIIRIHVYGVCFAHGHIPFKIVELFARPNG